MKVISNILWKSHPKKWGQQPIATDLETKSQNEGHFQYLKYDETQGQHQG